MVNILLSDRVENSAVLILDIRKCIIYILENLISERFKRFAHPFWRAKIFIQSEALVSFEFKTISPNGRDKYSSLHTFGEMLFHFKTKYIKPCSGFKPIPSQVLSFPQKCVKSCPTVVQLYINQN